MMVLRVGKGGWDPTDQVALWTSALEPGTQVRSAHGEDWAALVAGPFASIVHTADGPVLFQGRIHHRPDLCSKLGIPETDPRPDAELAASCLAIWGTDTPHHMEGTWALARWIGSEGVLDFSPDHVATIGLFHGLAEGGHIVGTHLPLLLARSEFRPRLDAGNLAMMITGYPAADRTAWLGISSCPPGRIASCKGSGPASYRTWWNPRELPEFQPKDRDARLERLRQAWKEAVRESLDPTGSTGLFLSAGLDSSLIGGWAAPMLAEEDRGLLAMTESPHPDFELPDLGSRLLDEWDLSSELAGLHPNIDHARIRSGEGFLPDLMTWLHQRFDTPVRNGGNHSWIRAGYGMAADRGVRTILWGSRGNATVSYHADPVLARGEALVRFRWQLWWRLNPGIPGPKQLAAQVLAGLFPGFWLRRMAGKTTRRILSYLDDLPLRPRWLPEIRSTLAREAGSGVASRKAFVQMAARGFAAPIHDLHGIHLEEPTADRRVAEICLRLPFSDHLRDGWNRFPARALGEGIVPDSILRCRLRGVQAAEIGIQFVRDAQRYRGIWETCVAEPGFGEIVDVEVAGRWLEDLLDPAVESDAAHVHAMARAIDVGLFVRHARLKYGATISSPTSEEGHP